MTQHKKTPIILLKKPQTFIDALIVLVHSLFYQKNWSSICHLEIFEGSEGILKNINLLP